MGAVGSWGWSALEAAGLMPSVGGGATYIDKVLGYSPIAYWPLNEASGTTAVCQVNSPAQDGTYSGVTLGQTGIGDGETCGFFDGVNDSVNVFSATLASAFSITTGSALAWYKVANVGVWTDGTLDYVVYLDDGSGNFVIVRKSGFNNDFQWFYDYATYDETSISTTDWMALGLTWSKTASRWSWYLNGSGVTNGTAYGMTSALSVATIGPTGSHWPHGWIAHVALFDTELSATDMTDLATVV